MPNTTPTVYIVEDDITVRGSLEALIRSAGWRPETAASAEDLLARPGVPGPSCLLLDVTQPDHETLAVQRRLAAARSEMPIIMISGQGDVPMTVRAIKAGAVEFLVKPLADEVVLGAVREAVEQSGAVLLREAELRELRVRYATLSRREREVMALVVAGLLNKQVGGRLGISEITVKAHRGRVMVKMGADSLARLVTIALRLHLPSVPEIGRPTAGAHSFGPRMSGASAAASQAWKNQGGYLQAAV
ncbi:MAG TPA: LuxR C-terminal-related transcriptional regulator [Gemmatimonadales bacterium]|nr:LuxR C-terminal-related transcriptional regulator [Gemmatimonadales bacterium]